MHIIATVNVPIIFPAHAVDITSTNSPHTLPPLIFATSVFSPLEAKYKDSNNSVTKSSILSINFLEKSPPLSFVNPKTNAPNMACMPIRSVIKPATRTPTSVKRLMQWFVSKPATRVCGRNESRAIQFLVLTDKIDGNCEE
ncbi:hypothetical protein Fot_41402 [Forsythia ovata]|uniref:Uncharacterized protein n=1 Tax=Forsythia ovata TaxID=205694 RepID=A0ABD1RI67_9LAMI